MTNVRGGIGLNRTLVEQQPAIILIRLITISCWLQGKVFWGEEVTEAAFMGCYMTNF